MPDTTPPDGTERWRRRVDELRATVEAAGEVPLPLDGRLGALRRLADRGAEVDREARFSARLEVVTAEQARLQRRRDRTRLALAAGMLVAGPLIGWLGLVPGMAPRTTTGLAVGVALGVAAAAVTLAARGLARRRGARAWDWQVGRHRLLGDPSAEVRDRDVPGGGGIRTGDPRRPTDQRRR
ncbi:MAG: hypothetical protein ACLGIR_10430 [Actinomycetes bacterium]